MKSAGLRRLAALAVAVLCVLLLSGCGPFVGTRNPDTYRTVDAIAKEIDATSLGKVIWESRYGTGTFSAAPTLELYITGGDAADTLSERLSDAGFTSTQDTFYAVWVRDVDNETQTVFVRALKPGLVTSRHKQGPVGQNESYTAQDFGVQINIRNG